MGGNFARFYRLIEVIDVLVPVRCEVVVALIHFAHNPFQCLRSLLRVRDDRSDQVWNPRIDRELHSLRIDQDHSDLLRGGADHDGGDHRVDEG